MKKFSRRTGRPISTIQRFVTRMSGVSRDHSYTPACVITSGSTSKERKTMKSETNVRTGSPCQDEPNGVKIVSAQDFLRLEIEVPASFELRFPQCWIAQPVQNRYAVAIERETLAWLASYGIGQSRDEAEKLRKFNCGMYG